MMGNAEGLADELHSIRKTELPADAEVLLAFQYSDWGGLEDGMPGHIQDYFDWIAIFIRSEGEITLYEDCETS